MAFKHINSQTQTVPSVLFTMDRNARPLTPVTIYNGHGAEIFIGDETITTSGATIGTTLNNAARLSLNLNANDIVYAVSSSASATGSIVITYTA
jgi:hypothetical protein